MVEEWNYAIQNTFTVILFSGEWLV